MIDVQKQPPTVPSDALIRNEDKRESLTGNTVRVHVAEVWLRRDIRVSDIPAMVEKGLERERGLPETPFAPGIALHARRLTFLHPTRHEPVTLTAELPRSWRGRFAHLLRETAT